MSTLNLSTLQLSSCTLLIFLFVHFPGREFNSKSLQTNDAVAVTSFYDFNHKSNKIKMKFYLVLAVNKVLFNYFIEFVYILIDPDLGLMRAARRFVGSIQGGP